MPDCDDDEFFMPVDQPTLWREVIAAQLILGAMLVRIPAAVGRRVRRVLR